MACMLQDKRHPYLFLEHFTQFPILNLYLLMSVMQPTTLQACKPTRYLHFIHVKYVSSFIKPKHLFYLSELIRFMNIDWCLSAFHFFEIFKNYTAILVYRTNIFVKCIHQPALFFSSSTYRLISLFRLRNLHGLPITSFPSWVVI